MHAIVTAWRRRGCGSYGAVGDAIKRASWAMMFGVAFNWELTQKQRHWKCTQFIQYTLKDDNNSHTSKLHDHVFTFNDAK